MKRVSTILLFITMAAGSRIGTAQQPRVYTQYLFNGLLINPGYAGSHDALSVNNVTRKQWYNVGGSPFTTSLSAHTPVNKKNVSWGALVYQSNAAIFSELALQGVLAYRMNLSEQRKLSIGMAGGIQNRAIRYSALISDLPDPSIPENDINQLQPDISAGAYYYTNSFYVGLSSQNITGWSYGVRKPNDLRSYQHYFLSTGKVFRLTSGLKFKPSILLHQYSKSPLLWDLNAHFLIDNMLWVGLSYRHQVAINYMLRFNISTQLSIGYSYDQSINSQAASRSGAHEIGISYLFKYYKKNVVRPSLF